MNKDWQKKTKKRGGKILSFLLAGMLACSVFSSQVFAMDPGELENPIQEPEPNTTTSETTPPSSTPAPPSSDPTTPSSSEVPPTSSEPPSSSETPSSETPSENPSSEMPSSSEPEPSSSPSSDDEPDYRPSSQPSNNNNTNNNGNTGDNNTSHRPNTNQTVPGTIADAPDDKRDVLSSENWDELLNSVISNAPESTGSEAENAVGGIFSKDNKGGAGVSIPLIVGIIMLALGAGGVAFFIYSQFFYKRRKGGGPEDFPDSGAETHPSYDDYEDYDYNENYQDYEEQGEDSGYIDSPASPSREETPPDYNTAPIEWLDSDRDIRSHSPRSGGTPVRGNSYRADQNTPPPASPSEPPAQPKTTEDKMREIDWDKFFKDNQ